MALQQLPDEFLRDMLTFNDFTTRWRLRRCSRRWQHLLQSKSLNSTIILEANCRFPDLFDQRRRETNFVAAIVAVTPHIRSLICRGPLLVPDRWISTVQVGLCYVQAEKTKNVTSQSWRLIFVNVPDLMTGIMAASVPCGSAKLIGLEFSNVQIQFSGLWKYLAGHFMYLSCPDRMRRLARKLEDECKERHVHVPYRCYQPSISATPAEYNRFYSRFLGEILPALEPARLDALQSCDVEQQRKTDGTSKFYLKKGVEQILTERISRLTPLTLFLLHDRLLTVTSLHCLHSTWNISKKLPAGPINWTELPNLVTWLAYSYYCHRDRLSGLG